MKRPLKEGLKAVILQDSARFHMPGHKGRAGFLLPLEWDFTEIPETDDLHEPTGILRESQQQAASLFGAKESYYLVNGATGGLQAALLSVCSPGDRVMIPRNAHQSIHFGIEFVGAEPCYLLPKEDQDGIYAGLDFDAFYELVETEELRAAVFTYPTYEGVCWDIEPFLVLCKERGIVSIIDEAHGAHLTFFKELPPSALEMQADLVVQSTHKMLPAPTQTAILHLGTDRVPREWVREALHRTQTSSPSYLLMLGIEEALAWMVENRDGGEIQRIYEYREKIDRLDGIELFEGTRQDPYKLMLRANRRGLHGSELYRSLREMRVEPEWVQGDWVLCMAAPYQKDADWERLICALSGLPKTEPVPFEQAGMTYSILPERIYSTLEARKAPRRQVPLMESIGFVLAENLTPYPPGIPIIMAGERMNQEIAETLHRFHQENRKVYGRNHLISIIAD